MEKPITGVKEKQVSRWVLHYKRPLRLPQCFMILGAKKEDIYWTKNNIVPYKHFGSIYRRYSHEELRCMLKECYLKTLKRFHVDLHHSSKDRELYETTTKIANDTYERGLKMINNNERYG